MLQLPAYVEDLRKEARRLRVYTAQLQRANCSQKDNVKILEEVVKEKDKKIRELEKENGILKQEKNKLTLEIEKLTKTNSRYQIALFDHGNFVHKQDVEKKTKGGQLGHADTNREKQEDYQTYQRKRIFAKQCGICGGSLPRVSSTKQKILLDIVINPEVLKLLIESERQWCGNCKTAVVVKDMQSLPFTEFGMNTFMMTLILRFTCHSSFANIATVMSVGYGLSLSPSDVSNLLKGAKSYLGKRYEELKKAVRKGNVMYADETGWLVHGQKAWMWIMTNGKVTVYVAAESRGKGIFEEMYEGSTAFAMHDGYASYESVTGEEKTAYCWAHVLRFCYEETIHLPEGHIACQMRDRLVDVYQTIRAKPEWTPEEKDGTLRTELDSLLSIQSEDQAVKNIQHRVKTQKKGLIRALLITEDGTNNLAERELRNVAIKRTISHGSDTYKGMETTAVIGSVLQTLSHDKEKPFIPTLKKYLQQGIQEKYSQYIHTPYCDS